MDQVTLYQHHILWQYGRIHGQVKDTVITFGSILKVPVLGSPGNTSQSLFKKKSIKAGHLIRFFFGLKMSSYSGNPALKNLS